MPRQSDLMRNTLLPLTFRHRKEELEKQYPGVLALLSYSPIGMEEGFRCIDSLRNKRVRLRLWVDPPLTAIYSVEEIVTKTGTDEVYVHPDSGGHRFSRYPHLFLPVLSYSLVSKVKRVVSQEVILQAYAAENLIIEIDSHTIITPLAHDLAKQLGIEFRLGRR